MNSSQPMGSRPSTQKTTVPIGTPRLANAESCPMRFGSVTPSDTSAAAFLVIVE